MQRFAEFCRRLWPDACAFCDAAAVPDCICRQCKRILPWNEIHCCCCGQPLSAAQPDAVPCADCQARPPSYAKARAPLRYEFPADEALKAIKFRAQLWYAPAFAGLLLEVLRREFADTDALVPVPLHRWRQARRGFNQAHELSRPLARATGIRILSNVVRVRATPPQVGLNATERRKNMKGAFSIRGELRCCHPLIVDDVITTGATSNQLVELLLDAGAVSVGVLAVARAGAGSRAQADRTNGDEV